MKEDTLWTGLALVGALNARVSGGLAKAATGVSIDTRTLQEGDLFVALKGDSRDGHEFVRAAFEKGAAAAVIDEAHARQLSGAGPMFVVRDVQEALEGLGAYARGRSAAYVTAVTGSVGKTSTKDMARLVFSQFGTTHASPASYNNQWGVPLSLARMPAATRFGVFELGMNHAGEIAALAEQVKPHVAMVTRVAPVHLEYFASLEDIARAKAEIFSGVLEGGVAIVNQDDETREILILAAQKSQAEHLFRFGESEGSEARLLAYRTFGETGVVEAEIFGRRLQYTIGAPGRHFALNSLAVLLAAQVFDLDLEQAGAALAQFTPPSGRGRREKIPLRGGDFTLIDESYNANPTSMRAAFQLLAASPPQKGGRRIAVLGDMLELGPMAGELHAELAPDLEAAHVDLLFTAGSQMARLYYAVNDSRRGAHRGAAAELEEVILNETRPGDVVMVKGSNGSRMARIVAALKNKSGASAPAAS